MNRFILGAAALGVAALPSAALACASCGCMLTADWLSQGLVAQPGTTVQVRYDYIPQTELIANGTVTDPSTISFPTDREIELKTYNSYATVAVDHQFAGDWGFNIAVPFIHRPHDTIDAGDTDISHSDTGGLGDIRAVVRWQGLSRVGSITGLQAGVVLPTGATGQNFDAGPNIGQAVDRGLQPGTGTVQAIVGAYHFSRISPVIGYLLQATAQVPLDANSGYRPPTTLNLSGGLSYTGLAGFTPRLQVNAQISGRESGINANPQDSGGETVNLAPGFSAPVGHRLSAFGYVQLPLYTRVNGYQLVPKASLSVGIQLRL